MPLDVFGYGAISQEAFDYIYVPTYTRGLDTEQVYSGNVSADLTSYGITSPWASQGIGVVIGVEHRRETLKFEADEVAQSKGTTELQGKFNVSEIYGEIEVPVLQDLPFAKSLTVNAGYRLSDYSSQSKKISTYKFEVDLRRSPTFASAAATTARSGRRTSVNSTPASRSATSPRRTPARARTRTRRWSSASPAA